jgi:hypothetical protein
MVSRPIIVCRHCRAEKKHRGRGLCDSCYRRSDVREQYDSLPLNQHWERRRNAIAKTRKPCKTIYAVVAMTHSLYGGVDVPECLAEFKHLDEAKAFSAEVSDLREVTIEAWTDFSNSALGEEKPVAIIKSGKCKMTV